MCGCSCVVNIGFTEQDKTAEHTAGSRFGYLLVPTADPVYYLSNIQSEMGDSADINHLSLQLLHPHPADCNPSSPEPSHCLHLFLAPLPRPHNQHALRTDTPPRLQSRLRRLRHTRTPASNPTRNSTVHQRPGHCLSLRPLQHHAPNHYQLRVTPRLTQCKSQRSAQSPSILCLITRRRPHVS